MAGYNTKQGKCITGDSIEVLAGLKDSSINLIITSPPFSNQRKKKYDNFDEIPQDEYGSLVIDIRSAYEKGKAVESIYPYEFLVRMVRDLGYSFCQTVYWI